MSALIKAVRENDVKTVKNLIDNNCDLEGDLAVRQAGLAIDETALMWAAGAGHQEIVQLLIDAGAIIDAKDKNGNTALMYAAKSGNLAIVKLLIDSEEDKLKYFQELRILIRYNSINKIKELMEGDCVLARNYYKKIGVIEAVIHGCIDVAKILLEKDADIEFEYGDDKTPLLIAAQTGQIGIVKLLIEAGANLEARDNNGNTALILAAANNHIMIVRLLIDKNVDLKKTGSKHQTALMYATKNGYTEIIKLLETKLNQKTK